MVQNFCVDTFNAVSMEAQRATGVDPSKCIALATTDITTKTPIPMYLGGLSSGILLLPASGEWLEHDIKYHVDVVRELPPSNAAIVSAAAGVGFRAFNEGDLATAKELTFRIDEYLGNNTQSLWSDAMFTMMRHLGRVTQVGNSGERVSLANHRHQHAQIIREAVSMVELKGLPADGSS